jgi:hypothetical protein
VADLHKVVEPQLVGRGRKEAARARSERQARQFPGKSVEDPGKVQPAEVDEGEERSSEAEKLVDGLVALLVPRLTPDEFERFIRLSALAAKALGSWSELSDQLSAARTAMAFQADGNEARERGALRQPKPQGRREHASTKSESLQGALEFSKVPLPV